MEKLHEQLEGSRYKGANRYLDDHDFGMMMFTALCLHLVFMAVYGLLPQGKPSEVPVRTISVKFGEDVDAAAQNPAPPEPLQAEFIPIEDAGNAAPQPSAGAEPQYASDAALTSLDSLLSDLQEEKKRPEKSREQKNKRDEKSKNKEPLIKYVRSQASSAGAGSALGNSSGAETDMLKRYEQVISLWIARNRIYPEEARRAGLQGEAVVRVRVSRAGKILKYRIERSSGHRVIDAALGEMVRRSNPVPAIPAGYPGGDAVDFLIPVDFTL